LSSSLKIGGGLKNKKGVKESPLTFPPQCSHSLASFTLATEAKIKVKRLGTIGLWFLHVWPNFMP